MPAPRFRSRTFKRIRTTLPSGTSVIHYRKPKPVHAKCGKCGTELKGIARELPGKMKNLPVSKKRTERPYGGNLCSACSRSLIKAEARK
ncbi:MAG: 50S ribosomal protein L34e [archaeon]